MEILSNFTNHVTDIFCKIIIKLKGNTVSSFSRKYPRMFYSLCLVETAERFSFHVMRSMLVLYMIKVFHFSDSFAYAVFASFTALLYFTPLIGGYLTDKYFGKKQAVLLGSLTLSLGYFLLYQSQQTFYFALAMVAVGNGFFMPNIANCIGEIASDNEAKHEAYFSIFYTALNIGAFLPPFIITWIIFLFGWQIAFLISSIIMLSVTLFFIFYCNINETTTNRISNYWQFITYFAAIIFFASILSLLIQYNTITNAIIYPVAAFLILHIMKKSVAENSSVQNRLYVCLFLTFFSILFWLMSEQTAMSLAVFTEYNVNRTYGNLTISTLYFFSLNPFFIIILGPLFSKLWTCLDKKDLNPSIPAKFAIGTILMGAGFVVLPIAIYFQNNVGLINPVWLVLSYFLQACGELAFSPIGMSMIIELSPKYMVGLMMGLWYFATAIAYSLAGYASQLTCSSQQIRSTSAVYSHAFGMLGWITIAAGIAILFMVPLLKRLMASETTMEFAFSQK